MPRNSSGTYSLYTPGNPVVTNTVISSTWANNSLADIAIALTDSLSRTGDGGMQAPLELDNGTIGAPGLTWATETTSGLYRAGAGDFRYSVGGVDVWRITAAGVTEGFADGTAALPSMYFVSDPNTGVYRIGADNIGITAAGALQVDVNATRSQFTGVLRAPAGAVGGPAYSFTGDTTTGMYQISAANIGFAAGGTRCFAIGAGRAFVEDGTASSPSLAFQSNIDMGMYRVASQQLGFATSGAIQMRVRGNAVDFYTGGALAASIVSGLVGAADGSAGMTALGFVNDPDTGFYRAGANQFRGVFGGVTHFGGSADGLFLAIDGTNSNANAPYLYFANDTDTGITYRGTNQIGFAEGGTGYAMGFRSVPRSTTATTLVAADLGRCVAVSAAIAIPASVFSAGDCVSIYNDSGSSINITIAAGTLRLGGTTTTGTRALAARGLATLWFNVGGATPEVIASGSGLT